MVLLYVVCHDEDSREMAAQITVNRDYMQVIMIPTTKYFESYMFHTELMKRRSEWKDQDFVGMITYKANVLIDLVNLDAAVNSIKNEPGLHAHKNIFAFYNLPFPSCRYDSHPLLRNIWQVLLQKVCGDETDVFPRIDFFYRNYWMCRPSIMEGYIAFFKKCVAVVEKCTLLDSMMNTVDDRYSSGYSQESLELLERSTGYRGCTHTCFVYERLINFFAHHHGHRMYRVPASAA